MATSDFIPKGNPYESLSHIGDWAKEYARVKHERDILEMQQKQHDILTQQWEVKKGEALGQKILQIQQLDSGPLKNQQIENLMDYGKAAGIQISPTTVAALKDPSASPHIAQAISQLYNPKTPDDLRNKGFAALGKVLSGDQVLDLSKAVYGSLEKVHQAEEQNKTKLQAAQISAQGRKDAAQNLYSQRQGNLSQKQFEKAQSIAQKVHKDFRPLKDASDSIFSQTGANGENVGKMTGPQDQVLIEAMQQLSTGKARFSKEGINLTRGTTGLFGKAEQTLAHWKEGDLLNPKQRLEILQAARQLKSGVDERERQTLSPILRQVQANGWDASQIFTEGQLKAFGLARPGATGSDSPAPASVTDPKQPPVTFSKKASELAVKLKAAGWDRAKIEKAIGKPLPDDFAAQHGLEVQPNRQPQSLGEPQPEAQSQEPATAAPQTANDAALTQSENQLVTGDDVITSPFQGTTTADETQESGN